MCDTGVVGSGSIAMMTDWLYGKGVEVLLCCGSCGVLADIPSGDVIIPVRALSCLYHMVNGWFLSGDTGDGRVQSAAGL